MVLIANTICSTLEAENWERSQLHLYLIRKLAVVKRQICDFIVQKSFRLHSKPERWSANAPEKVETARSVGLRFRSGRLVIRGFFGDDDVVRVTFDETCIRNSH